MTKAASTTKTRTAKPGIIAERLGLLRTRHGNLDADIAAEGHRRRPDTFKVQFLKRARLRTKDEITYLSGLLRTISRPDNKSAA